MKQKYILLNRIAPFYQKYYKKLKNLNQFLKKKVKKQQEVPFS
jgi:hypothetical protein